MIKTKFNFLLAFLTLITLYASSSMALQGRVDIGPAWVGLDVLESGKTIESRQLLAVKGDATLLIKDGIFIKPSFLLGSHKAQLAAGSIAIGQALPIKDCFILFPQIGYTWTYLHIDIDIELLGLSGLRERFRSRGPYIGLDLSYKLTDKLTLVGTYQYAWSRTHTVIKPIVSSTSHSSGSNYAIGLDYSLNPNWSISLGLGYNISLSREKHGLRGKGAKLGLAYYF